MNGFVSETTVATIRLSEMSLGLLLTQMPSQNANLYDELFKELPEKGESILLETSDGRSVTYADAHRESGRMARCLNDLGVEVGDRVSIQVEKSVEALFLYLACLRGGFTYHPLNKAYREKELAYFLDDAQPKLVVCEEDSELFELCRRKDVNHEILAADGSGSLMELCQSKSEDFDICKRSGEDLAALLYSSGTTGTPKGIPLTHGNLISNGQTLCSLWGFSDTDRLLHALPIFHVHGLFVALSCVLMSGASMHWLTRFDAESVKRCLSRCTVMMGVPTYYTRLLADSEFDHSVCAGMRLFVSGSAPLSNDTFQEFYTRTGHKILERYGMTETGMNTSNPLVGERKAGTVGRPLPGVDARVVDADDQVVEVGVVGGLQVKGPNVFPGYWQRPEQTLADFTQDGYFRTGDLATIDGQGYISIVGRSKDLIISGGLNVYPKEVESVLDELPGVLESAVIGAPHPDFGEAVVGVVVAKPGVTLSAPDIIERVKTELANFKVPKRIEVVEALPRNAMGKVEKNRLREKFA